MLCCLDQEHAEYVDHAAGVIAAAKAICYLCMLCWLAGLVAQVQFLIRRRCSHLLPGAEVCFIEIETKQASSSCWTAAMAL